MKKHYPRKGIALLGAAVLLAGIAIPKVMLNSPEDNVSSVYAEGTDTVAVEETDAEVTEDETQEADEEDGMWKPVITDYDSSLSMVEYEEVEPTEEQIAAMEEATALKTIVTTPTGEEITVNATVDADGNIVVAATTTGDGTTSSNETSTVSASGSEATGSATGVGVPASLAYGVQSGQFGFTTYGYGHCAGMSQNGANYYATYGGYSYQDILAHYYPGTYLVSTDASGTITADGQTGSVLSIISQIVFNEMSCTMDDDAMKAQAIAAYTYIMFNGGRSDSVICKPNPPQNVVDAVASVLGQALFYDGDYALTVYGASSGGATASAYDIWGTSYPYLTSVACDYDDEYDPYYGEVTYKTVNEVRYALQAAFGIWLSDNPSNWISFEYGDSGYVHSVNIDGQKTVTGEAFRAALGLRSTRIAYVVG